MTNKQMADQIIKELTEANCTPNEMLVILKMAREKYLQLKNERNSRKEVFSEITKIKKL